MIKKLASLLAVLHILPWAAIPDITQEAANAPVEDAPDQAAAAAPDQKKRPFDFYNHVTLFETPKFSRAAMHEWLAGQGHRVDGELKGGGGGGGFRIGKIIMEGTGHGLNGKDQAGQQLVVSGGNGGLGFVLVQNEHFSLFPLIGGGGHRAAVKTEDGPGQGDPIGQNAAYFTLGLGANFFFKVWKIPLNFGLRIGVAFRFGGDDAYGPPAGPFFRLVAGPKA